MTSTLSTPSALRPLVFVLRALAAAVLVAIAAGCATTPTPTGEAQTVPRSRVLGPTFLAATPWLWPSDREARQRHDGCRV